MTPSDERHRVEQEVEKTLTRGGMTTLINVKILREEEVTLKKRTFGRPTKHTRYTRELKNRFDLSWNFDNEALERARRTDGVFPWITNYRQLSAEEILRVYKRQSIIEKRFSQLKTEFLVAKVYLAEVSRIQSLLCVYFMVLLLQTLMERELRLAMQREGSESLSLYPECRACRESTARRVIDVVHPVSRHRIIIDGEDALDLHPDATPIQCQLMTLFGIPAKAYDRGN